MPVVTRTTGETRIRIEATFGEGTATVATTIPFLDHMLTVLARYAGLDLIVSASGDLRHHLVEDVAISLGEAVRGLIPAWCARYADRTVAMDDALVQVTLDAGGRFYYRGPLPSGRYDHWMRSFAECARVTLHLRVVRGTDRHHVVEAGFKALGLCLRDAMAQDRVVPSTKGPVVLAAG